MGKWWWWKRRRRRNFLPFLIYSRAFLCQQQPMLIRHWRFSLVTLNYLSFTLEKCCDVSGVVRWGGGGDQKKALFFSSYHFKLLTITFRLLFHHCWASEWVSEEVSTWVYFGILGVHWEVFLFSLLLWNIYLFSLFFGSS